MFDKVDDNATGIELLNEEISQIVENKLVQLQTVFTDIIALLLKAPLNDMNDFKVVGDALAITSQNFGQLLFQDQESAGDIIVNMTRLLTNKNLNSLGPNAFEINTQSFIISVSNLFNADSRLVRFSVSNDSASNPIEEITSKFRNKNRENQARKSADLVAKLKRSVDNYLHAMQSYKVPSEKASFGDTPSFSFTIKKEYGSNLRGLFIGSSPNGGGEEYGFVFPNLTNFFNESSQNEIILLNNLRMKDQPYTWDLQRTDNILSESQILSLSNTNGTSIELKNISKPIHVSIRNIPEKVLGQNISLRAPFELKVKSLELPSKNCKMLLRFTPLNDPNNETTLKVLIQYGKVSTKNDYDIELQISNKDRTLVKKSNVPPIFDGNENGYNSTTSVLFSQKPPLTLTLHRNQKTQLLTDGSILLWDFVNSTYGFSKEKVLYLSFLYDGPMPPLQVQSSLYTFDEEEHSGTFDYEMKSYCVECNYWNEFKSSWMSDGCELDLNSTNFVVTKCKCSHLTAFGGFYVAPNVLPKPSWELLKEGYVLLIVVVSILLVWVLGLFIMRRFDISDSTKFGVCALLDNRPEDQYLYEVTVNTGTRRSAGTMSNIFFNLTGELCESGVRRLKDGERKCFQRSSTDFFIMTTNSCLGDLNYIRIWHDNKGGGWYLRNIVVTDLQTDKCFYFIANRWIAADKGDCSVDCCIPASGSDDITEFSYIFSQKTKHDLSDSHIWFSIYARPPRSYFTRCQRYSVAICLLMMGMTASCMYYKSMPPATPATENKVAGYTFTWQQLYVGFVSACITFPVNLILAGLFRVIKPARKLKFGELFGKSKFQLLVLHGSRKRKLSKIKDVSGHVKINNRSTPQKQHTKSDFFYLPHGFLYITWFICISMILGGGYVVLSYGMKFGNKTSLDWLASISVSVVLDAFVFQPVKILLTALFVALVKKSVEEKYLIDMHCKELAFDEKWLNKQKHDVKTFDMEDIDVKPLDAFILSKMKEVSLNQKKMYEITNELMLYVIFAILVFYIGYLSQESTVYYQTRDVIDLFKFQSTKVINEYVNFSQLQSACDFWNWLEMFFLPQVFPEPWSNNRIMDFPGRLFLSDLVSKIVNGVRIRQIRVQPHSCQKAEDVKKIFTYDCLSAYKSSLEETRDFNFSWSDPKKYSTQMNSYTMPWRYQTSENLDSYPLPATLETYYGGGYVIEIFPKWKNKNIIDLLKQKKWIDRQTRAVIVEFALFNAATNHFNMVTIVFEFPPSGGMIPYFNVETMRLYTSTAGNEVANIGSQVLFILLMILFSVRECRVIYRSGREYCKEFWNLVEIGLIFCSILEVFFYFYRGQFAKDLLRRLPEKQPQRFINLQFASYWNTIYVNIISLVVFFVTIKFIKLLRFNQRVSMLSSTLKISWYPLSMLGISFALILCPIIVCSNIIFGVSLDGYINFSRAIISVFGLLLGKFSFYQFKNANSFLGPMFFFGFNISMNWIIMNMFISILNDSFTVVCSSIDLQNSEYHILDFITSHFKGWLGIHNKIEPTKLGWDKENRKCSVAGKFNKKQGMPIKIMVTSCVPCGIVNEEGAQIEISEDEFAIQLEEKFAYCDRLLSQQEDENKYMMNYLIKLVSLRKSATLQLKN